MSMLEIGLGLRLLLARSLKVKLNKSNNLQSIPKIRKTGWKTKSIKDLIKEITIPYEQFDKTSLKKWNAGLPLSLFLFLCLFQFR